MVRSNYNKLIDDSHSTCCGGREYLCFWEKPSTKTVKYHDRKQTYAYSRGSWSVPKILHQYICSHKKIDLTVDGIVYKLQKSDHSGHFVFCCDWPLVPKLTVIGAFNRELINYLGNHKIFKYFMKWIGSCWQMNWYNILGTLQLPRL